MKRFKDYLLVLKAFMKLTQEREHLMELLDLVKKMSFNTLREMLGKVTMNWFKIQSIMNLTEFNEK